MANGANFSTRSPDDRALHFLKGRDDGLAEIILSIREEELAYLHHAEARIGATNLAGSARYRVVTWATGPGDLAVYMG